MYVSICMYTYIYRVLGKCKSRLVECKSRLARFAGENRVWGLCIASGRGDRVMGGQKGSRNLVLVIVFFSSVINRGVWGSVNA